MKQVILVLVLFIGVKGFAQDELFKKDNTKLEVKILEISPTEIKYKLFTYQDGPIITILKSDVALIIYKNGVHEVINTAPTEVYVKEIVKNDPVDNSWKERENEIEAKRKADKEKAKIELDILLSTKNSIGLNLVEPLNGCIGVTYMRELLNNYLNVYVPINIGFTTPFMNQNVSDAFFKNRYANSTNFKFSYKTIEIGLGVNFQTTGKKAITHFVGPFVDFSQLHGTYDETYYNSNGYGAVTNHDFIVNRWGFLINNGFNYKITKNFGMCLNAAIGYRTNTYLINDPALYEKYPTTKAQFPLNAFKLGMSLGYRF